MSGFDQADHLAAGNQRRAKIGLERVAGGAICFLGQPTASVRDKQQVVGRDQALGKLSKLALGNARKFMPGSVLGLKMIWNKRLRLGIPDFDLHYIGWNETIKILKDRIQHRFEVKVGGDGLTEISHYLENRIRCICAFRSKGGRQLHTAQGDQHFGISSRHLV